jgi:hypothetical protein
MRGYEINDDEEASDDAWAWEHFNSINPNQPMTETQPKQELLLMASKNKVDASQGNSDSKQLKRYSE